MRTKYNSESVFYDFTAVFAAPWVLCIVSDGHQYLKDPKGTQFCL